MSMPTPVNGQITDAVTQANVKVLGDAPAQAMGAIYQTMSHAYTNAQLQGMYAQQQANATYQAATTMGVTTLYSVDPYAVAVHMRVPVTAETVQGHLHSRIGTPQGKKEIAAAVKQANEALNPTKQGDADLRAVLVDAIGLGLDAGLSKQHICYLLHEVADNHNISLLYPFNTQGEPITADDVSRYYTAIIAAHQASKEE